MLDEKQIRLIKKYYVLSILAFPSLFMSFAILIIWTILALVDNLAFHNADIYMTGCYVCIILAMAFCVVFGYSLLTTNFGMRSKKWKTIVEKLSAEQVTEDFSERISMAQSKIAAGRLMQRFGSKNTKRLGKGLELAGQEENVELAAEMSMVSLENAQAVAEASGVEMPKPGKCIIGAIVASVIVQVGVFIPHFVECWTMDRQVMEVAGRAVEQVLRQFESYCTHAWADDPKEGVRDIGYDVAGYFADGDEDYESTLRVTIDNAGKVEEVTYNIKLDITLSKEENLQKIRDNMSKMWQIISGLDVGWKSTDLYGVTGFSEEFLEQFAEGSYYEAFHMTEDGQDNSKIYMRYDTESKEEYNQYSESDVWMNIEYKP